MLRVVLLSTFAGPVKRNLMKKNRILLVLFMAAMTLAACKKDGSDKPDLKPAITPVGTNDGTAVTKTIGSAGRIDYVG